MRFEGAWQVSRRIEDSVSGQVGLFEGVARFLPNADGLRYHEAGGLRLGEGAVMRAERVYLWRIDGRRVEVSFEDGRPFHEFDLGSDAEVVHQCDPDLYRVRYDFGDWPRWSSCWHVSGPRKAYVMTSDYARVSA